MLEKLSNAFGPSGCEYEVTSIIKEIMSKYYDDYIEDNMGNLIYHNKGMKLDNNIIMLTAHTDEVGFMITSVTDDGYLKFATVGGIDPNILISKKVVIGTNKIKGVIGVKPIHHNKSNEQNIKISDLYIDVGALNKDDALKIIEIGDYVCFDSKFKHFGNNCIKGKALDDRIGCYILTEIAKAKIDLDYYLCFVTQEEIGCRGAIQVTKTLNPDMAIIIEGTTCSDVPGTTEYGYSTHLGNGPALSVKDGGAYSDRNFTNEIYKCAKENNIKCQFKRTTMGGNDASAIQIYSKGTKVSAVSVPCRYIHSQSCVASIDDVENTIKLLKKYLKSKVLK